MSKKSYKQMQNRLYREIKRRIIAENKLKWPILPPNKVITCERKIETIGVRKIIQNRDVPFLGEVGIKGIQREMAHAIGERLFEDGYIEFLNHEPNDYEMLTDTTEIRARLDVVRPEERY